MRHLAEQRRLPDAVLLCAVGERPDDALIDSLPYPVSDIRSERGLTKQRNAILDSAADADVLLFIDDDFLCAPDYLERLEGLMERHPEIAMATGTVVADGIKGPGIEPEEALPLLVDATPPTDRMETVYNGYGCNMAVRMSSAEGLRFDEALPLYGWLEDVDFSRRLAARGRIVRSEALRGVHLGVKSGRSPGRQLGYSQISNPVRLMRAGTMARRRALSIMLRNVLSNAVRAPRPEPWVDRVGRLRGNLQGLSDLLSGRLDPMKAVELGRRP